MIGILLLLLFAICMCWIMQDVKKFRKELDDKYKW